MSDNTAKDTLNERYAIEFAERTNQTLHWYYSLDKCKGSVLSNEELLNHLQSVHSGKTKGRLGRLPLVLGMPVLLAQNFDVEDGIVNGSRGIVKRIRYRMDSEGKHFLTSVVVEVQGSNEEAMPHLKPYEVPVLSDSIDLTFQGSRNVHGNVTIKRTQVPIVPAFAMTAHRSQGQTLTEVIVDLQSCRGSESPYIMLSRVTSLEGLLILRPFSKTKICCNVSEDLRLENRRLREIALKTVMKHSDDEIQRLTANNEWAGLVQVDEPPQSSPPPRVQLKRQDRPTSELEEPEPPTKRKRS